MSTVLFAAIAEAGPLEHQAILLAESIRRFAGRHRNAPIVVISPRAARRPSAASIRALEQLHVDYREYEIASAAPEYGTSYRIHSAARLERESTAETIVFLDSDIFFAGEPDLNFAAAAAARPVDVQGMCSVGDGDPNDAYWRDLCRNCDVAYDALPFIETSVDRVRIKASYNGGFIAVRRDCGVFQRTEDFFRRTVGLTPPWQAGLTLDTGHGRVAGAAARLWGSSQACFSLAVWGAGEQVSLLPPTHNFPAHHSGYVDA